MSAIINSFELLKLNFDILKDWNIEIANIPGYSGWLGLNDIDNIAVIYQWQGTDEPIDYKLHEMLHCALRAFRKTESIDAEERLVRDICYIFRDALYHATTPAKGEDVGEMKLFEFSANITCAAVVAAKTEEAAREAIKTWERAWFETGDFQQVNDVDLVDIREIKDSEMDSLHDLAHEVVA